MFDDISLAWLIIGMVAAVAIWYFFFYRLEKSVLEQKLANKRKLIEKREREKTLDEDKT